MRTRSTPSGTASACRATSERGAGSSRPPTRTTGCASSLSSTRAGTSSASGRRRRPGRRPRRAADARLLAAAVDQLDPVVVGIADEAEPRAAVTDAVRLTLRLDPLLLQAGERLVEVVHGQRDVAVP